MHAVPDRLHPRCRVEIVDRIIAARTNELARAAAQDGTLGKALYSRAPDRIDVSLGAQTTLLRDLCDTMKYGSLCALGGFTPYPVLSALNYFPEDFGHFPEDFGAPAPVLAAAE